MTPRCQDAVAALRAYLDAESGRDLGGALARLTDDHCGFGTGADEIVLDVQQVREILSRQFAEVSDTPTHRAEILHTVEVTDDVVLVMALISYRVEIAGSEETLRPRFSFVMRRDPDGWRLAHLHASMPWSLQQEGESFPVHEVEERNRRLEALVAERTAEVQRTLALLEKLATTDKLTGVFNRAKLDELIADEHRTLRRHARPASIAILDVDHFKAINDTYGHLTGDRVLSDLARLIGQSVRDVDRVGRWGGEEFLILLPDTTADGARLVALRVRERLAAHDFGVGPVTVSVGVAQHREGESTDAWISRADEMLYRAKNGGRDRILVE